MALDPKDGSVNDSDLEAKQLTSQDNTATLMRQLLVALEKQEKGKPGNSSKGELTVNCYSLCPSIPLGCDSLSRHKASHLVPWCRMAV